MKAATFIRTVDFRFHVSCVELLSSKTQCPHCNDQVILTKIHRPRSEDHGPPPLTEVAPAQFKFTDEENQKFIELGKLAFQLRKSNLNKDQLMLKPIEIQKAIDTSDYKTILSLCLAGKQIRIGIHRHIMKVSICG